MALRRCRIRGIEVKSRQTLRAVLHVHSHAFEGKIEVEIGREQIPGCFRIPVGALDLEALYQLFWSGFSLDAAELRQSSEMRYNEYEAYRSVDGETGAITEKCKTSPSC